jgi:type II secretory pathway pseudopilin PulG
MIRIASSSRIRRRGWVAADAITALAIVLILLGVLTTAVTRQQRGANRLAETRAAVRLAEDTLTAMQSGAKPPATPDGMKVTVRPAEAKSELAAPPAFVWVDITITHRGRDTTLSGLARADAINGEAR